MACTCVETTSKEYRENHNGNLITTLFEPQRVVLATEKFESRKRGRPPALLATFCPFCGTRYVPADQEPKVRAA